MKNLPCPRLSAFCLSALLSALHAGVAQSASATFAVYLIEQETGEPVEGADVLLIPTLRHQKEYGYSPFGNFRLEPQGLGNYKLEHSMRGPFVLQATAFGWAPYLRSLVLAPDTSTRQVIEIARSGLMRGIVTDSGGRRLQGVQLSVAYTEPELLSLIETMTQTRHYGGEFSNQFGEYEISSGILPDRTFLLEVMHEDFQPYLTQELQVAPGRPLEFDITLTQPGTVLRGVVEDQDGNPIQRAIVAIKATLPPQLRVLNLQDGRKIRPGSVHYSMIARNSGSHLRSNVFTGPDGSFVFSSLAPGDIEIRTRGLGYKPSRETIQLEPGENFITLVLSPPPGKRP